MSSGGCTDGRLGETSCFFGEEVDMGSIVTSIVVTSGNTGGFRDRIKKNSPIWMSTEISRPVRSSYFCRGVVLPVLICWRKVTKGLRSVTELGCNGLGSR